MSVTPVYAALLTLFFVALSIRVIASRRSEGVSLGDGGIDKLRRRMRAHANFAEYVPLALLLMMLLEMQGQSTWILHLIGISLTAGRLSHAYGVSQGVIAARIAGMALTFNALIAGALANIGIRPISALLSG